MNDSGGSFSRPILPAGTWPCIGAGGTCAPAWRARGGGIRRGSRWGTLVALWLVSLSPLLALNPERKADSYSIQGWFTEHGLPSYKVRALVQTRDGYLWLATAQGLARFDGSHFTVFTSATNPELRGGGFFTVLEAPDGTLWFGGDNGLFRWRNGHFDRFTTEQGLAHNYVRSLALTRDGAIAIGTRTGFSFWRGGRITTPGGVWKQITGVARSYLERADGTILLGTGDGLWRISGESIAQLSGAAGLQGNGFTSLLEGTDGSLWIGYSGGVQGVHPDGRVENYGAAQGLATPRVITLAFDRGGNLWIATDDLLYRLAHGRIETANYEERGAVTQIQRLCEDREGGLWLATTMGLFRLKDNVSSTIGPAEGLAQASVFSVFEAHDGAWWIGLWNGSVYRYDQTRATRLAALDARGLDQIHSFAEEPVGTLWIGANSGLYRLTGGVLTNIYRPELADALKKQLADEPDRILSGMAHGHVNAVTIDREGGLWIATDGALYHGTEGYFRAYTTADGLPGDVFKAVIRARNGDVWVTVPPLGAACLHEGKWTSYLCGAALSPVTPRAVYEDSAGSIWITTEGGGLNRFKDGRWRIFTARDGLADDFISGIMEDNFGNLWIACPPGIMRIPQTDFAEIDAGRRSLLQPRVFNRSDGLPDGETNQQGLPNAWRTRDGRLLFANDRGVAVIDPAEVKTNELMPPLYVERLVVNGTDADLSRPVVVPPGGNDIEIHYTGISLPAPEKVRFKIRLAPLDSDWVDMGARRDLRYARLPPGNYTFQVMASNNDGVWNKHGAALTFRVRPFFYRSGWFIGLVAVIGVAGILGVYWERARRARHQRAVLEELVHERTRQLRVEVEGHKRTEVALQSSEVFLNSLVENLPVYIFRKDRAGRFMFANRLFCERFHRSPAQIIGTTVFDFLPLAEAEKQQQVDEKIMTSGEVNEATDEPVTVNGKPAFIHLIKVPVFDAARQCVGLQAMFLDVTERKRAEAELEKAHRELLVSSRQAGMAEVATGVLHNVGNVLNSVNVSATLVADHVRHTKALNIVKLAVLFDQHKADLAGFVTTDPRGQMIPAYLGTLAESLTAEHKAMLQEIDHLRKNVEHIKDIVAMQQAYAKTSGIIESIPVLDMLEDALRINASGLARHKIDTIRDYQARPVVTTDKYKVMQILINLVRNAKYACGESGRTGKQITLRTTADDHSVRIAVIDNGVGIPAENLTLVFNHGFTTKKDGHGFGLHSGALAAKELGGSLTAESAGPGLGATFILELPCKVDTPAHENPVR